MISPRYWGEGPPHWVEGIGKPWERPCQTAAEAERLKCEAVGRLRRNGKECSAIADLADRLEHCGPRHRCLSGGCPECARAHQRWFVDRAQSLIKAEFYDRQLYMVTVVP